MILAEYLREEEQKRLAGKMMEVPRKQRVKSTEYNPNKRRYAKRKRGAQTLRFFESECYKRPFPCQKNSTLGKSLVT